ncbi:MAG: response regulator [Proteobacteria bacterium]|nr:response regulator [Pseudomonadota bacterium]
MNLLQKILIIDDETTNLKILSLMLDGLYDVRTAVSGEEALQITESFIPDIILLDIMMPGIDGYEVCRRIRADRILSEAKILLISAKNRLEDRLKGYDVGADDYVAKPFDEEELRAKVKAFARLNEEEHQRKQLNRRLLLRQQDIPNMLWDCDNDFRFTYMDENSEALLGHPPEDLLGKPIADCLLPEEMAEFQMKFRDDINNSSKNVHGLTLDFVAADGSIVPLQVFADAVFLDDGSPDGMVGIFRDMGAFSQLIGGKSDIVGKMAIRVDSRCRLVFLEESIRRYMGGELDEKNEAPDFLKYLVDPTLKDLLLFSFDQKEDVPFPVEIKLTEDDGSKHHFTVRFEYRQEGPWLEGNLIPVGAGDKLDLVSQEMDNRDQKLKDQEEVLNKAVLIDADMQESILTDARNLSAEILDLIKSLESYAFPEEGSFDLEEFGRFLYNHNLAIYSENLRLLGNKIHGLKGNCGFLMSEAKLLCHRMEEITRPLAEHELVLSQSLSRLMKQFIFQIEEMLDQFQKNPEVNISVEDWLQKIDRALDQSKTFLGDKADRFAKLIGERSLDHGEIRKRKKEEYLSVSLEGYELLAEKVKDMFYSLTGSLIGEQLIQAGNLYNQFLNTHQQIKKIPLNLTRYERLVPKLATDYDKEADFFFENLQVKADREFWNVVHEILNHVLKNAVIHGLETPEERRIQNKEPTGKVTVELKEDALHILLSVLDDGRGIDKKKIAEKAVKDGLITPEQLEQMPEDEIPNLLFIQGMSTADSVDDNAGRGVGMNAVQEAMNELQGSCRIETEPGRGCSWNFSFAKSNVSLPCVIIAIDDFHLAIPEDYVESFIDYSEQAVVTVNQEPTYKYNDGLVPLLDSITLFEKEVGGSRHDKGSIVILKNKREKKAMVISDILDHLILPVLPLPKVYRDVPIYQGIAIYNNIPVQVINVENLI